MTQILYPIEISYIGSPVPFQLPPWVIELSAAIQSNSGFDFPRFTVSPEGEWEIWADLVDDDGEVMETAFITFTEQQHTRCHLMSEEGETVTHYEFSGVEELQRIMLSRFYPHRDRISKN